MKNAREDGLYYLCLDDNQRNHIIGLMKERYEKSENYMEMLFLKDAMRSLNEPVNDWVTEIRND